MANINTNDEYGSFVKYTGNSGQYTYSYSGLSLNNSVSDQDQIVVLRQFTPSSTFEAAATPSGLGGTKITGSERWETWTLPLVSSSGSEMYTIDATANTITMSSDAADYVWDRSGTSINLPVFDPANDTLIILRKTHGVNPFVSWNSGSRLTAEQLNNETKQLLNLTQEIHDKIFKTKDLNPFYNAAEGLCPLGADGKVPSANISIDDIEFDGRTINTSDGISGGGNLGADLTLAVDLTSDTALSFTSGELTITLNSNHLEFTSNVLDIKIKASGGILADSQGLYVDLTDSTTLDDSTKALSAAGGKAIQDDLDLLGTGIQYLGSYDPTSEPTPPVSLVAGMTYDVIGTGTTSSTFDTLSVTTGDFLRYKTEGGAGWYIAVPPTTTNLSDYFKKDGSIAATGDFDLGSNKITLLDEPTASTDATTKNYVDTLFGTNDLDGLSDVTISGVQDQEIMVYDSDTSTWVNSNLFSTPQHWYSTGTVENQISGGSISGYGDGSNVAFVLGSSVAPATSNDSSFIVSIDGISQVAAVDYTVTGDTITFTTAPPSNAEIDVTCYGVAHSIVTDVNVTSTGSTTARSLATRFAEIANVKDFGAVGDGVTDDTAAIQAALDSGAKTIRLSSGTYKVTNALTVPVNVSMYGEGISASIIDASSTTTASNVADGVVKTPDATLTALPALSTAITRHDHTMTFTSAPSVSVGDVIVLYNDTDSSWSGFRSYYRAGEMVKVASISGSVVTIQGAFAQNYATADIDLYKMTGTTCSFRDFAIVGLPDASTATRGLILNGGIDVEMSNLKVTNASYIGLNVTQCFGASITGCIVEEDFSNDFGGDYGFSISNSHHISVEGGYFSAIRHGFTIGGGDYTGAVTNRYITVSNSTVSTTGGSQAMDWHGNTEWITITNCTLDGGIIPAGNNWKLDGNLIRGHTGNANVLCYCSELQGTNISITNNVWYNNDVSVGRGAFIDIGGNSDVISSDTVNGGTINISDNTFHWDFVPLTEDNNPWIKISQRGYTGDEAINVSINNNTVATANKHGDYGLSLAQHGGACTVRYYSGDAFNNVNFTGNSMSGAGGLHAYSSPAAGYAFKNVNIENNLVSWAGGISFYALYVEDSISYVGNTVVNAPLFMAYLMGVDSTDRCKVITCTGNSHTQGGLQISTASTTDSSFLIYYADEVFFHNNFAGHDAKTGTVNSNAAFTIGETITGGTSGVTATLTSKYSTNSMNFHNTSSGSFTLPETITGSISGATTIITYLSDSNYYLARISHVTNCWRDNNIDYKGKGYSVTTITNDYTTI